jgi:hypothetical protein
MAVSKRTKKQAYRRVLAFPQAKGKIVERVELDVNSRIFPHRHPFQGQDRSYLRA